MPRNPVKEAGKLRAQMQAAGIATDGEHDPKALSKTVLLMGSASFSPQSLAIAAWALDQDARLSLLDGDACSTGNCDHEQTYQCIEALALQTVDAQRGEQTATDKADSYEQLENRMIQAVHLLSELQTLFISANRRKNVQSIIKLLLNRNAVIQSH